MTRVAGYEQVCYYFACDDFAAKTHRRDAGRTENFKHMRGEA
jgi:hypothetical protein